MKVETFGDNLHLGLQQDQDVGFNLQQTGSFMDLNQNDSTGVKNLKILIVNDEIMTQIIIRSIFERVIKIPSDNIKTAENGQEAIVSQVSNQFDLIIMDLNMPVMGGFEATKKIRDICDQEPYIVALSASQLDSTLVKMCKDAGFDDQFTIPLTADQIQTRILPNLL